MYCFIFVYSLQSSSSLSVFHSSFDSNALESYINDKREYFPFNTSVALLPESAECIVEDAMYQDIQNNVIRLAGDHQCKRIVIGSSCFDSISLLIIDGLKELETLEIREWSFTAAKSVDSITQCGMSNKHLVIANCPKLKSIQIGHYSFSDYGSFKLESLPSLQFIDVGCDCFYWTSSFLLTGYIW